MNRRILWIAIGMSACVLPLRSHAQDVPGIEICTVEKTMERRTSCLQSNVDFLQKTVTKLALDNQRRKRLGGRGGAELMLEFVRQLALAAGEQRQRQQQRQQQTKERIRATHDGRDCMSVR